MEAVGQHTQVRQEQDEYVCHACGCRWDVREEAPACDPKPEAKGVEKPMPKSALRYPPDKVLIFKMILSAEKYHEDISKHFKPKVQQQYQQWRREKLRELSHVQDS